MSKPIKIIISLVILGPILYMCTGLLLNELSIKNKFDSVTPGMETTEVLNIMGTPQGTLDKFPKFCTKVRWKGHCKKAAISGAKQYLIWRGIDHAYIIGIDENEKAVFIGDEDT